MRANIGRMSDRQLHDLVRQADGLSRWERTFVCGLGGICTNGGKLNDLQRAMLEAIGERVQKDRNGDVTVRTP
jgi:hypothetical protein